MGNSLLSESKDLYNHQKFGYTGCKTNGDLAEMGDDDPIGCLFLLAFGKVIDQIDHRSRLIKIVFRMSRHPWEAFLSFWLFLCQSLPIS